MILNDIYLFVCKEAQNPPSPDDSRIIAIRVSKDCFHQMCKEDPSIYDTKKFCGIPIQLSEIEFPEVIWRVI